MDCFVAFIDRRELNSHTLLYPMSACVHSCACWLLGTGGSYGMTCGRLLRLGIFEELHCRGLCHGHAGLVDKYDEWHLQPRRWVRRKEGWSAAVQSSPVQSSRAPGDATRHTYHEWNRVCS